MKKIRTIYRHLGYYNNYEDIQSFCTKVSDGVTFTPKALEDNLFDGAFYEDTDPDNPDTSLIVEEETSALYYSSDKKYIFVTSNIEGAFDVDVEADNYDPDIVDSDVFVDVYEFVRAELPFSLEEFKHHIPNNADGVIRIGMSFDTDKQATMWSNFPRIYYSNYDEWVEAFYREFVFQFRRTDIKYLDARLVKEITLFD